MLVFGGVLGGGFTWICFKSPVKDDLSISTYHVMFHPWNYLQVCPWKYARPQKENVIFQPFKRRTVGFRGCDNVWVLKGRHHLKQKQRKKDITEL